MDLKRDPVICGVGHTAFGRLPERTAIDLEAEAARNALDDAGLKPEDIDGLLTAPGPAQGIIKGITPHYLALGQALGLNPDYAGSELLGGAASIAIIQRAAMAIEAGLCSVCLCVLVTALFQHQDPLAMGAGKSRPRIVWGGRASRLGGATAYSSLGHQGRAIC